MKHLNWDIIEGFLYVIFIAALFCIFSCQKDEAAYEHPRAKEAQENYAAGIVENRTGTDEIIFFDGSGVFAKATGNVDSIQKVVNLRQYDSIKYTTTWLSPSITVQGVECWRYLIQFYHNGEIALEEIAFAKYRGIQYTQILALSEGWNDDVLFFNATRTLEFQIVWDDECLKWKPAYRYIKRIFKTSGPPEIRSEYIKSNHCTRNTVQYPRKFKP